MYTPFFRFKPTDIDMCDDPIPLPEMTHIAVTPVLESTGGLAEVKVNLQLRSRFPVKLRWFAKKGQSSWADSLEGRLILLERFRTLRERVDR
jgi:hypothetical protein